MNDSLPLQSTLVRRHINVEDKCPVCLGTGEDALHVFRDCHFARQYWAIANIPMFTLHYNVSCVWDWIQSIKGAMNKEEFMFFVVSCWSIWYNRNRMLHEGER